MSLVNELITEVTGVLGGTQSLHTNSMDEALALPTEHAVKIALRTQQILAHEAGVSEVIDPLAGSYFIEDLTNRMEAEAEEIFETIEGMGGMVEAIKRGWPQREIARSAYEFQRAIEDKTYINVSVNAFIEKEEEHFPILRIDPAIEREQIARVKQYKARRDAAAVKKSRERIQEAAKDEKINLMPRLLEAVKVGVTLGEVIETLKEDFGVWREPPVYW